jgi:hypothetical protein
MRSLDRLVDLREPRRQWQQVERIVGESVVADLEAIARFEREYLRHLLLRSKGNMTRAAKDADFQSGNDPIGITENGNCLTEVST